MKKELIYDSMSVIKAIIFLARYSDSLVFLLRAVPQKRFISKQSESIHILIQLIVAAE